MQYTHLGGRKLLHFYSIEIIDEDDSRVVYFNSDIHFTKRAKMPVSYGRTFTQEEILRDSSLVREINDQYGKVTIPDEAPF